MEKSKEEMFLVVLFEDNRVKVVPKKWVIDSSICVYPNYTNEDRIQEAVETREIPDFDWETYNITVLGTCDSIKTATEIASHVLVCSLDTQNDEVEEPEETILTEKRYGYDHEDKKIIITELESKNQDQDTNDILEEPCQKMPKVYSERLCKSEIHQKKLSQPDVCCKCADSVRSLSQRMTEVQQDMNTLIGLLDRTHIVDLTSNDLVFIEQNYDDIKHLFPITSLEELEVIENMIVNDPVKRNKIEKFIKSFGRIGDSIPVYEILNNVFSKKMAVMFCYEGLNKSKRAARSLRIIQIINDSILDKYKNTTQSIIRKKMMQWFRDATKRLRNEEKKSTSNILNKNYENPDKIETENP